MTLPDSNFLSAPLWLITTLHLLTLTLHLAAMGCLLGGALITFWASTRKVWPETAATGLSRLLPAATAATVSLGVAPLLFLQLVFPRQVYTAAILSAWYWLAVVAVVIMAYYAFYRASFSAHRSGRPNLPMLALGFAGLLYVSLVYSSVFSLAERPGLMHALYGRSQSGLAWNPALGAYALRWLHMALGALTLGGFFVSLVGQAYPEAERTGKWAFLGGMAAAAAAGIAYLATRQESLLPLMRSMAMPALVGSVLLSLASLHFYLKRRFWASGSVLFLSLFSMVYVRHTLRLVQLGTAFNMASWRIAPQWSPFLMFLVCFIVMLAVLAWMLRIFFRPGTKTPTLMA